MKHIRLWVAVGAFCVLAAAVALALPHALVTGDPGFSGGCYLTTIKDAGGYFASRSVITLHADHTMSADDSAEQGPDNYFGSQMGTWEPASNHRIVARTINFRYPLGPSPGIARSDYVINLARDRRQVTGTITLRTFSLEDGNPLESEGTLIGTFTFAGGSIKPQK